MNQIFSILVIGLTCISIVQSIYIGETGNTIRERKEQLRNKLKKFGGLGFNGIGTLSLFSVVKFKNTYCYSNSPAGNGHNRHGVCYTNSECTKQGGEPAGGCADGFGVCCLFYVSSGDFSQNITYLRNDGFPKSLTDNKFPKYKAQKCTEGMCFLRLDFVRFDIGGTGINGNRDGACIDSMTIKSSVATAPTYPAICGLNTGLHIYVEFGPGAKDTIEIAFAGSATSTPDRIWELKARQIECNNPNRPPAGCLQYFTEATGRIITPNYDTSTEPHSSNLAYSVCIRQNNACCTEYSVCEATQPLTIGDFSSWTNGQRTGNSITGDQCTGDYISIPGATATCSRTTSQPTVDKICGAVLNPVTATGVSHVPVCSCRPPFIVRINTDDDTETANAQIPRGVCLNYRQVGNC